MGRCSVSVTLIVDSITSKADNTVAQTFWYTSTKPDRPRGFDSGRSLFTKVQNGNAAASCYSVTLIEEMSVTQVGSHFYTRRIASRRNCLTLQCREEVWRITGNGAKGGSQRGGRSGCESVRLGSHCDPGTSASDCVRPESHCTPVGAGGSESVRLGPHCVPGINASDRVRSEPHRTPSNGEGVRSGSLPAGRAAEARRVDGGGPGADGCDRVGLGRHCVPGNNASDRVGPEPHCAPVNGGGGVSHV